VRILYITQWFSSIAGGGEVVFYNLAKGMANRGHKVEVVSHRLDSDSGFDPINVDLHRISPPLRHLPPPSIKEHSLFLINASLKCSKVIREKRIDLIHANNLTPVIVGSILSKVYGIPLVVTIHDIFLTSSPNHWTEWAKQNNSSRLNSIVAPIFEKLTVRMPCNVIHTVSNSTKLDLLQFVNDSKVIVIPNGIDLRKYSFQNYVNDYEKYIIYIGRLVFYKNLGVVIRCFKEVVQRIPDAKLIVVGDGPMRNSWQQQVAEMNLNHNIIFTGYLSNERKMELLSKCSALVLPSYVEGLPLAPLEAFAMGKPVLLADIASSHEIVDNGTDGFILPHNDEYKWAESILHLLRNKRICEEMGKRGRFKVQSKFNLEISLDAMELLYSDLCEKTLAVNRLADSQ
jgi:glycosyltransferase involved in cell wall biosynthesis